MGRSTSLAIAETVEMDKVQAVSATFYTLGYEQTEPETFVRLLRKHRVEVLVDIREIPLSRKKGFSKNQLRELLAEEGIDYVHIQRLGSPKDVRHRLHETGSWWEFVKAYQKVLVNRTVELDSVIELAKERRICLLCVERRPEDCHRSMVAREIERRSNGSALQVQHILY